MYLREMRCLLMEGILEIGGGFEILIYLIKKNQLFISFSLEGGGGYSFLTSRVIGDKIR